APHPAGLRCQRQRRGEVFSAACLRRVAAVKAGTNHGIHRPARRTHTYPPSHPRFRRPATVPLLPEKSGSETSRRTAKRIEIFFAVLFSFAFRRVFVSRVKVFGFSSLKAF